MTHSGEFQFCDDIEQIVAATSAAVLVPNGLGSKHQLMQALVEVLSLPEYFGNNWDALDECLRDRLLGDAASSDATSSDDGLQQQEKQFTGDADPPPSLCLVHHDLPLADDEPACLDYLTLLEDTLHWAEESAAGEFAVVFPASTAGRIEALMRQTDDG